MKAKDIDAARVIELVRECNEGRCDYSVQAAARGWGAYHGGCPGYKEGEQEPHPHCGLVMDLAAKMEVPEKVLRAKLAKMIERGEMYGCACGCRGDLIVPGSPADLYD